MNHAVILGAGSSTRMEKPINKLLLLLGSKTVLESSIAPFIESSFVDTLTVVVSASDKGYIEKLISKNEYSKPISVILGGEERQDSVYAALKQLKAEPEDVVVIHNGANPLVDKDVIEKVIAGALKYGGAAAAFRSRDTIKEVTDEMIVVSTLPRSNLWQMQTPQAGRYDLLIKAFVKATNDEFYGTDDVQLLERMGEQVKIVECSPENFKITTTSDLERARRLVTAERVGLGQDSHRFTTSGKKLMLGGVEVPGAGLEGNSDADVILHSLFNALSTAIGGKSLGFYADPMCEQGILDSAVYLKVALEMVKEKGFLVSNIALMIECKTPRLEKYEELIKVQVASLCSLEVDVIGLAVTSGEEGTDWGRGLGMQCHSMVLLKKVD
ncbi:MAG: 2-C-methyl-D-erythritol 4-phosphate cytidylyltransferase [Nanoarchaeota archaeon]|nr:2-C-methyl-D-erythritol 4-phosphate cytidylyltransferase [Nanoarchaeota archaeon]